MQHLSARRHLQLLLVLLTMAISLVAKASPPTSNGERLYAPCVVCHQPNAWGSPDGTIPNLAGKQKRYLEKQLAIFRSGARIDTAMQIVAVHATFDDPRNIATVANYLSRLDTNPNPVQGSGEHLRLGAGDIHAHLCCLSRRGRQR